MGKNLSISLTSFCDQSCLGCDFSNLNQTPRKHETYESIVSQILASDGTQIDLLLLTGGEPLEHPNLIEIIQFLRKDARFSVDRMGIATNGRILLKRHDLLEQLTQCSIDLFLFPYPLDEKSSILFRHCDIREQINKLTLFINHHYPKIQIVWSHLFTSADTKGSQLKDLISQETVFPYRRLIPFRTESPDLKHLEPSLDEIDIIKNLILSSKNGAIISIDKR